MSKKITLEDVKNICIKNGYLPLFDEYKGSGYKYAIQDKELYKYEVYIYNINEHNPNKFTVYNPYTIENIKRWLILNNNKLQLTSTEYKGAKNDMEWICPCCNEKFKTSWSMIYSNNKKQCNNCSIESTKNKQKHSYEYIKTYIESNTNLKLLSDKYVNAKEELDVKCSCGTEFKTSYLMIKSAGIKCCKKCTNKKLSYERKFDIKYVKRVLKDKNLELISKIYINNTTPIIYKDNDGYYYKNCLANILKSNESLRFHTSNIYTLYNIHLYIKKHNINTKLLSTQYCGSDKRLKFRCECGNIFYTSLDSFIGKNKTTCDRCSNINSKVENIIDEFLSKKSIKFVKEYRFDDCRDRIPLPFDFYLPSYNICIEYDGEFHYKQTTLGNDLRTQKIHDKIKNNYCKKNNIKLLRIPYWDFNNIENILESVLP